MISRLGIAHKITQEQLVAWNPLHNTEEECFERQVECGRPSWVLSSLFPDIRCVCLPTPPLLGKTAGRRALYRLIEVGEEAQCVCKVRDEKGVLLREREDREQARP